MSETVTLPTWDLSPYFPSLDSTEFREAFQRASALVDELSDVFDREGVEGGPALETDERRARLAASLLGLRNRLEEEWRLIRAYVYAHVATDSRDELALSWHSRLAKPLTVMAKLDTRFKAWLGRLDVEALVRGGGDLGSHAQFLRRAEVEASHQLSPAEEALLADQHDTGLGAWTRLYRNVSSQIVADFRGEALPISTLRNLAHDPDPETRRAAYEAELGAWRANETVLAAAMNSIKGETGRLAKRRGWPSLLDQALFENGTDRETLEAMQGACREAFPTFRRYLRAKAKALGHDGGLPWYDLFAPVGQAQAWEFAEAERFMAEKFEAFEPGLGALARRAARERWVDAGSRPGKVDGAFCMDVRRDESRILMNHRPSFESVSTLAHELGHAYHNLCLSERTPAQRETPMTFAETASIFCETIVKRAALAEAGAEGRLAILEASLQGACQVVLDVHSRFLFERETTERRDGRELSARELCEVMLAAQEETYGEGLHPELRHRYMWAAKPHYYSESSFYNYPYTFGLLFGLGLYALYQAEPSGFVERYRGLLSRTGMEDGHSLTREFGIDLREPSFWRGSLAVVGEDVEAFAALL